MGQTPDDFKRRLRRVLVEFTTQSPLHEIDHVRRELREIPQRLVLDLASLAIATAQQHGRVHLPLDLFLHGFDAKFSSFGTHAQRCTINRMS